MDINSLLNFERESAKATGVEEPSTPRRPHPSQSPSNKPLSFLNGDSLLSSKIFPLENVFLSFQFERKLEFDFTLSLFSRTKTPPSRTDADPARAVEEAGEEE
jgi:hypothetical protein